MNPQLAPAAGPADVATDLAARTDPDWPLGPVPADLEIGHVRAVTPTEVIDDALVVVREGRIAGISRGAATGSHRLDGRGLLVIPGIIDIHSDAIEKEQAPRPTAQVPWEFALTALEGRFVGAGVTTAFHGAAFQHQNYRGVARTVEKALDICDVVDHAEKWRVDHRVLHRLDILSEPGAQTLRRRLDTLPPGADVPLVSHEDHTPGQGQYKNAAYLVDYVVAQEGHTRQEAEVEVARLEREGRELDGVRQVALDWLAELAAAGRIRLEGHDPDGVAAVDALVARHGTTAEFPTVLAAAQRAREQGLLVAMGAPNLLRGGSHAGNVSAAELIAAGLVDALASDYLPAALLGSVWQAVRGGLIDLPHGVRLITSGPAAVAGLDDRGSLEIGQRADLAIIDDRRDHWPCVVTTLRAGATRRHGSDEHGGVR